MSIAEEILSTFPQSIKVVTPHDHTVEGDEWATAHVVFAPLMPYRDEPGYVYRDRLGRRNSGGEKWLRLRCAMLDKCPAEVLVRLRVIEDYAQAVMDGAAS